MKKILLTLIFITALTFAQQAQAQETKEYVTVCVSLNEVNGWYSIAYPDGGTVEKKVISSSSVDKIAPVLARVFNDLASKGYRLVSSNGGDFSSTYIFEK